MTLGTKVLVVTLWNSSGNRQLTVFECLLLYFRNSSRGVFDRQDSFRSDYLSDRESRYGIVQQASIDSTDSRLCYLTSSEVSHSLSARKQGLFRRKLLSNFSNATFKSNKKYRPLIIPFSTRRLIYGESFDCGEESVLHYLFHGQHRFVFGILQKPVARYKFTKLTSHTRCVLCYKWSLGRKTRV